jgi:hypothetical protein
MALVDQLQIRLVHECGGLQKVARPFPSQGTRGLPLQLGIDDGKQTLERVGLPVVQVVEQACNVVRFVDHLNGASARWRQWMCNVLTVSAGELSSDAGIDPTGIV